MDYLNMNFVQNSTFEKGWVSILEIKETTNNKKINKNEILEI